MLLQFVYVSISLLAIINLESSKCHRISVMSLRGLEERFRFPNNGDSGRGKSWGDVTDFIEIKATNYNRKRNSSYYFCFQSLTSHYRQFI